MDGYLYYVYIAGWLETLWNWHLIFGKILRKKSVQLKVCHNIKLLHFMILYLFYENVKLSAIGSVCILLSDWPSCLEDFLGRAGGFFKKVPNEHKYS